MTDRPTPPPGSAPAPDSDEALAAYLAGDLDHATTAAVEQRLDDPAVAARLDALAETLVRLRGVDEAPAPEGFERRLAARLRDARTPAEPDPAELGPTSGGAPVSSLDEARSRRSWAGVGAAAAVLVVLALGSLAVLQVAGSGGGDGEAAFETMAGAEDAAGQAGDAAELATEGAADEAAPEVPETAQEDADGDTGEDTLAQPSPAPAPPEDAAAPPVPPAEEAMISDPVVVDDAPVSLPTDADVARLAALPELQAALGTPVDVARQRANAVADRLGTAPAVQGSPADACLETALDGYDPPLVVRVQGAAYGDESAAVVYVVASSEGGEVLDRGTAVVVEPATCTVLSTVPLTG